VYSSALLHFTVKYSLADDLHLTKKESQKAAHASFNDQGKLLLAQVHPEREMSLHIVLLSDISQIWWSGQNISNQ
jgi:hypothetical protein